MDIAKHIVSMIIGCVIAILILYLSLPIGRVVGIW